METASLQMAESNCNSNCNASSTTTSSSNCNSNSITTTTSTSTTSANNSSSSSTINSNGNWVLVLQPTSQAGGPGSGTTAAGQSNQPRPAVNMNHIVPNSQNLIHLVTSVNRPGAPPNSTNALGQNRQMAPRVILGHTGLTLRHAGVRGGAPGQVMAPGAFSLPPGIRGGTFLLKTENGQVQIVNVQPNLPPPTSTATSSPGGQSIPGGVRFQVPASASTAQGPLRGMPPMVTMPVSMGNVLRTPQSGVTVSMPPTTTMPTGLTVPPRPSAPIMPPPQARAPPPMSLSQQQPQMPVQVTQPLTIQTAPANTPPSTPSQMSPKTAKQKCKNFLATLLRLASDQPETVAQNVKNLIQSLIDGVIQPEEFTTQLQKELNSSPQPCLVPFLKKSLPHLRHSLSIQEMSIDGVRPPPLGSVTVPPQSAPPTPSQPVPPPMQTYGSPVRAGMLQGPMRFMTPGQGFSAQLPQSVISSTASPYAQPPSSTPLNSLPTSRANSFTPPPTRSPAPKSSWKSKPKSTQKTKSYSSGKEKKKEKKEKEKDKDEFSGSKIDDDDVNDVAAMGGVNLAEESQRILAASSELVGTQIRSCKDENFLFTHPLQLKVQSIAAKFGIEEVPPEVVSIVSHAVQERLKSMVEKLNVIAEHRQENLRNHPMYEVTQDVRSQIKFLEELDRIEKKRKEEEERQNLIRIAKQRRPNNEDPEQAKLKQKAKEMQRAEMEEVRQREANETALLAIGPRKKTKLNGPTFDSPSFSLFNTSSGSNISSNFRSFTPSKQIRRIKRVNLRDLQFLMEQEKETARSPTLYRLYSK